MMRVALAFSLMFIAFPACSEWVKAGETDEAIYFIDPESLRKDGQLRRIWELQDLKQRQARGDLSRRVLWEYDCENRRERTLSYFMYSEPMAAGRILLSAEKNPSDKWIDIAAGTAAAGMLQIVCAP